MYNNVEPSMHLYKYDEYNGNMIILFIILKYEVSPVTITAVPMVAWLYHGVVWRAVLWHGMAWHGLDWIAVLCSAMTCNGM